MAQVGERSALKACLRTSSARKISATCLGSVVAAQCARLARGRVPHRLPNGPRLARPVATAYRKIPACTNALCAVSSAP